jgi:DNA modification methylase
MTQTWIVGDSFTFLPTIPDQSIPCILTDVPYDLKEEQKIWLHREFQRICSGIVIVFSPPENQWILPADQYGFWIKPISTKNTSKSYSRFVEMIFFYGHHKWYCDRHWSQYTNVFTDLVDNSKLHPYRKPPSLIERLIKNHVAIGETILDPFAGSGVVRDVAQRLAVNTLCIEIEEKYKKPTLIHS